MTGIIWEWSSTRSPHNARQTEANYTPRCHSCTRHKRKTRARVLLLLSGSIDTVHLIIVIIPRHLRSASLDVCVTFHCRNVGRVGAARLDVVNLGILTQLCMHRVKLDAFVHHIEDTERGPRSRGTARGTCEAH